MSIDSRYNEGYIATLERAVRGGRPFRYRFGGGVSVVAVGCIERCVRITVRVVVSLALVPPPFLYLAPRPTQPPSCVLFDYDTRLCGLLFILDLMPL